MKRDLVNFGALASVQASNALAPLVIFPFLLHVLGSAAYADVALAEALSLLVLAVVVFSFEVTGVSELVRFRHDDDHDAISTLFSSVLYVRLALFAVSAVIAVGFYTVILGKSWLMISLWTLVPLAYVFQSVWFYQGIEQNAPVGAFTAASRIGCVVLIFLFVEDNRDGYLVPAIMGTTYLAGGLASFGYALFRYRLRLRLVRWPHLLQTALDGKEIFAGNIAVALQRDLNVLILGVVGVPASSLAAYSIAEKLTKSLQAVARPLNQLFFPKVVRAIRNDAAPTPAVARKIARQTVPQLALVVLVLAILIAGYFIAQTYTAALRDYPDIDLITDFLIIMVPSVAFGIVNFMFGSVGLNYLGRRKTFFGIILLTGTTSALLCLILSPALGAFAAAACFTGAEVVMALLVVSRFKSVQNAAPLAAER